MSSHVSIKHKLQKINGKKEFNELLDKVTISTKDKDLMKMHYIEGYDFYYIAEELGYSRSGILKKHKRIINKLSEYL